MTGAGSTWTNSSFLYVGDEGKGTLTIENGGKVSNTDGGIGTNGHYNSDGTVTVTGAGSAWTNSGNLYVGDEGKGTLTIEAGAEVSNTIGYIGLRSSFAGEGTVTVTGTDSTWTNSDNLYVGDTSLGALTISDGGAVSNIIGNIGVAAGSVGTVTVAGADATWTNTGNLNVGGAGTALLYLEAGGRIIVAGTLYIGGLGTFNWNGGTFELNGSTSETLTATMASGMFLAGTGTFDGNTNFTIDNGGGVEIVATRYTGAGANGYTVALSPAKTLAAATYTLAANGGVIIGTNTKAITSTSGSVVFTTAGAPYLFTTAAGEDVGIDGYSLSNAGSLSYTDDATYTFTVGVGGNVTDGISTLTGVTGGSTFTSGTGYTVVNTDQFTTGGTTYTAVGGFTANTVGTTIAIPATNGVTIGAETYTIGGSSVNLITASNTFNVGAGANLTDGTVTLTGVAGGSTFTVGTGCAVVNTDQFSTGGTTYTAVGGFTVNSTGTTITIPATNGVTIGAETYTIDGKCVDLNMASDTFTVGAGANLTDGTVTLTGVAGGSTFTVGTGCTVVNTDQFSTGGTTYTAVGGFTANSTGTTITIPATNGVTIGAETYTTSGNSINLTTASNTFAVSTNGTSVSNGNWKLTSQGGTSTVTSANVFNIASGDTVGIDAYTLTAGTGSDLNYTNPTNYTLTVGVGGNVNDGTLTLTGGAGGGASTVDQSGLFTVQANDTLGNANWQLVGGAGTSYDGTTHTLGTGSFNAIGVCNGIDFASLAGSRINIAANGRINANGALDLSNVAGLQIVISTNDIATNGTKLQVPGGMTLPMIASCDFQVPAGIPTNAGTVKVIDATAEIQVAGAETMDDLLVTLNAGVSDAYDWSYDSASFDLLLEFVGYTPLTGDSNDAEIERAYGPAITTERLKQVKDGLTAGTAAAGVSFRSSQLVGQAIHSHLLQTYQGLGNNEGSTRGQYGLASQKTTSLRAQSLGAWANQDAVDTMTSTVETNLFGIAVGAERRFGSRLIGGVAFGGTWSQSTAGDARSDADMFDIELYGTCRLTSKLRSNLGIGYQYNDYSNQRIQGADTYTSNHAGNMFKGVLSFEHEYVFHGVRVTPIYGWEYYNLQQQGYTETGGTTPQTIDFNRTEAVFQRVGAQVGLFNRGRLSVNLDAAWLHNFGDATILLGGLVNGNPINLEGVPLHKDLAEMGVDCNVRLSRRLDLSLGYTATVASGFDLHTIDGVLAWRL